ncbi:MAG: sugar phosphate nucleotidyltransferase, partial [Candidatus Omnitrophica bacterium]|nr:sugar phosphate nucleotidyltransferase [Candidatus Omnitrophota bacterium]
MVEQLIGLIPAAGKGLRLYPYTDTTPKPLLYVDGVPIMLRNIALMRDQLGIRKIYIIVGYKKDEIIEVFGDGKSLGVEIIYIETHAVEKGLADGMLLAKDLIKSAFCVILGDEVYHDSNHHELLNLALEDFDAICAIK